jgi:predicted 3-demethylubiquinone-9 3-methyltransferase (glyoxalase superfamily)
MAKIRFNRLTPFLWYDGQAEDAAEFYCSIFKKSKILSADPMSVIYELDGQRIHALNGGPYYKLTPAFSFYVNCKDQKEVDYYWDMLLKGGKALQCGWLTDKFGLSWQVIPECLHEVLGHPDPEKAKKGMQAMLKMKKLIVKDLLKAVK